MPTDASELNLFDKPDPEMYVQQWYRQLFTKASTLAVSANRRHGLRDWVRTTAQLVAAGVAVPLQPNVVPELANNASAGAVANHKALKEDDDALARDIPILIEFALRTGGIAFRAKHTNSATGILDAHMQQLCDDVKESYGIMLPRQLDSLEAACGKYDSTLTFDGNASVWHANHETLRLNNAPINEMKKNSLLTQALSTRPEFREHVRQFLYSEPMVNHTFALMLPYIRRMNILFPAAAASTAHSFLAAAVADESTANATIDARIKALEDKNVRAGDKRRKKPQAAAGPAASNPPAAPAAPAAPVGRLCGGCDVWHQFDPIKYPVGPNGPILWAKCKTHNPRWVP